MRHVEQIIDDVEKAVAQNCAFILSSAATYLRIIKMPQSKQELKGNICVFLLISQDTFKDRKLRTELRNAALKL